MKKARIALIAIAVFAVASGVVAFKATPKCRNDLFVYTGPAGSGVCTNLCINCTITDRRGSQTLTAVSTVPLTMGCPNGFVTTPTIN